MTRTFRLLLAVGAGAVGLVLAGSSAAHTSAKVPMYIGGKEPSLTVEQSSYKIGAAATVDFFIFSDPSNEATAKMTIFSPAGYSTNIGQAPGTKLGGAVAFVKVGALAGSILPLAGPVIVGNPADSALQTASLKCTGSPTSQAIWVLHTSLQGQTIDVPDFVNKVGPYLVQQICLTAPQDPSNTNQAQLVSADYNVNGVFTNPSARGGYQWAGDFTPYINGTTTVNPAGTTEWRTYDGIPQSLTMKRVKLRKLKSGVSVTFAGALAVAGLNPTGIKLDLYAGAKARPAPNVTSGGNGKQVSRTRALKANGKYSITRKVKKKTFFQIRFENYGVLGSCQGASPSGLPLALCKGTDLAPITGPQIKVVRPKKKRR